ncbi:class I SAM-dependent methyltransferase [Candidatus Fermentibacteria bacterium]|nr:class I SAM-dependent methyltransferase [Candidatus Fermentibacteria bacterium]
MSRGEESVASRCSEMANEYDRSKDAQGWRGPEVVFGLTYAFVEPGQSVLDIGIGTGLGSVLFHKAGLDVFGMDMSPEMLDVCRNKGFAKDLKVHDLNEAPYPYASATLDHAVCAGVLNHFEDLGPMFHETSRILRAGGVFAFVVAHRRIGESSDFQVQHADTRVTMFRHGEEQIGALLRENGLDLLRELEFPVSGHAEGETPLLLKAYAARRRPRSEHMG